MLKNKALIALIFLLSAMSAAQVVSPNEIKDAELRALQVQYSYDLTEVGKEILADKFEYPFYLSRKLDLDEEQQKRADQRSVRFDRYDGQIVVAVSGNYYAAYAADKVNADHRAQKSFISVVMPVLKAAVPRFQNNPSVQGYAVEISHHVIGSAMGVTMEQPENVMVFLPQADAIKLVGSKDEETQQAALLEGKAFVNGDPVTIWLSGEAPPPGVTYPKIESSTTIHSAPAISAAAENQPSTPQKIEPPPPPPRDRSAVALAELQTSKQATLDKLVKDLGPQAHFVSYAEQSFVAFREGIYLELSLATDLPESAAGSRYKVAATAFDEHIAHLVRPTMGYFKDDADFDGIGFSTTAKVAGKGKVASTSEAVEFFFPFAVLRCYEKFDCTGQQLIDGGTVLINGERVALELQNAEGTAR
jgi:hypothetical protein